MRDFSKRAGAYNNWIIAVLTLLLLVSFSANAQEGYAWEGNRSEHVVYAGQDSDIRELWHLAGVANWGHKDLSQEAVAYLPISQPVGYAWEGDGSQHVVYVGADRHIHEFSRKAGASDWEHKDLTQETGAPRANDQSRPAGYAWEGDQSQHVIYVSEDGHIIQLCFNAGGANWWWNDLTQETGAPNANKIFSPSGYAWEGDQSEHAIYVSEDSHIIQLCFNAGGNWWWNDLTQETGAPQASSSPSGYAWEGDNSEHVVYRGADDHIHQLCFNAGGAKWWHSDLTQETGAPLTVSMPSGYAWEGDQSEHVVYMGADDHIHQLCYNTGGAKWWHSDLTQETGAPLTVSMPSGYAWEGDRSEHVVYISEDGHIRELWYIAGGANWMHRDLTQETAAPPVFSAQPPKAATPLPTQPSYPPQRFSELNPDLQVLIKGYYSECDCFMHWEGGTKTGPYIYGECDNNVDIPENVEDMSEDLKNLYDVWYINSSSFSWNCIGRNCDLCRGWCDLPKKYTPFLRNVPYSCMEGTNYSR